MLKVADIWVKKVAAEKRADAYSSLAKIMMKNPAKWGIKAEGLARPALQHEARLASLASPLNKGQPYQDYRAYAKNTGFRTTNSTPHGTSGAATTGTIGSSGDKQRKDLLWLSQYPMDSGAAAGKNMFYTQLKKQPSWRELDRTPLSMLSQKMWGKRMGKWRELRTEYDSKYPLQQASKSQLPRRYAMQAKGPEVLEAEMTRVQGANFAKRYGGETVVRRSEYPESAFTQLKGEVATRELPYGSSSVIYRDPQNNKIIAANPGALTNLDFYKKSADKLADAYSALSRMLLKSPKFVAAEGLTGSRMARQTALRRMLSDPEVAKGLQSRHPQLIPLNAVAPSGGGKLLNRRAPDSSMFFRGSDADPWAGDFYKMFGKSYFSTDPAVAQAYLRGGSGAVHIADTLSPAARQRPMTGVKAYMEGAPSDSIAEYADRYHGGVQNLLSSMRNAPVHLRGNFVHMPRPGQVQSGAHSPAQMFLEHMLGPAEADIRTAKMTKLRGGLERYVDPKTNKPFMYVGDRLPTPTDFYKKTSAWLLRES